MASSFLKDLPAFVSLAQALNRMGNFAKQATTAFWPTGMHQRPAKFDIKNVSY